MPALRSPAISASCVTFAARTDRLVRMLVGAVCLIGAEVPVARAQNAYRDLDIGRPIQTEDAYAADRYSLNVYLAPVAVARANGGDAQWSANPEVVYGLLPRTQIQIAMPVEYRDQGAGSRVGLRGVELGALHNFNAETRQWPGLALRGQVTLPVGEFGPDHAHPSLTAVATRTTQWFRLHANVRRAFRDDRRSEPAGPASVSGLGEPSRWVAGVALDRTFPLRALLLATEATVAQPTLTGSDPVWNIGVGARYQWTPVMIAEASLSRRVTGPGQGWQITFGLGRAIGLRALLPGLGPWGKP